MVLGREWQSILTLLGDFRFARQFNRLSSWLNAYAPQEYSPGTLFLNTPSFGSTAQRYGLCQDSLNDSPQPRKS